jgi:hypothetical protein
MEIKPQRPLAHPAFDFPAHVEPETDAGAYAVVHTVRV